MATLESLTASRTTAPLPQPGDGIYPTIVQHDVIASASHELWAKLVSEAKENTADLHIAENLIDLLARVPELYARHSKAFSIHDEPSPQMKFALEWLTTRDTACDRPLKRTYHHQTLAALRPQKWEYLDASEDTSLWSGHQASQMKHLSRLILAWAYILSSRWVEILKTSGEKASMQQSEGISRDNFWEVIIERRWHAIVIRSDKVFYAPWSVERQTAASSYVPPNRQSILQTYACAQCSYRSGTRLALGLSITGKFLPLCGCYKRMCCYGARCGYDVSRT